jgi:transcriptional regulator with XRE-family HTH domain
VNIVVNQSFGERLRELRKSTGMSQREVADKVGIDFTYLSKIESGTMLPPSEKVIRKLADALGGDKDELITLAGKVPSDVVNMLKNKEVLEFLRSGNSAEIKKFIKQSQDEKYKIS